MHRIPPELKVTIPDSAVAQHPSSLRSRSRLLVIDRGLGVVVHIGRFDDITDLLRGDLIVINETRVSPVRVEGRRPGGGRAELLFLSSEPDDPATGKIACLVSPSRRLREGMRLSLPGAASFTLIGRIPSGGWKGIWRSDIELTGENPSGKRDRTKGISEREITSSVSGFGAWLEEYGLPPLPPYIRRRPEASDSDRYQTVYARNAGSLAAPTAGLHFTPDLMRKLEATGAEFAPLTLDVGLGTFIPIRCDDMADHRMEREHYDLPLETAAAIRAAASSGRRVTAVGTTVVRVLESTAQRDGSIQPGDGVAELFIHPPYEFRVVERLLTNFHRPDSTLIQMIAALIGWELVNIAYAAALDAGFRFYSYGDAMLIV